MATETAQELVDVEKDEEKLEALLISNIRSRRKRIKSQNP